MNKENRNRDWLPNEVINYDEAEKLVKIAHEFADVRRYQWQEKDNRPDVYPCRLPITADEILDVYELKILTTGAFK